MNGGVVSRLPADATDAALVEAYLDHVRVDKRLAARTVECRGDYFLSPGNFYLFGCVLDEFFAGCTAINSFTAFTLFDSVNHETLKWPAKIGHQRLL